MVAKCAPEFFNGEFFQLDEGDGWGGAGPRRAIWSRAVAPCMEARRGQMAVLFVLLCLLPTAAGQAAAAGGNFSTPARLHIVSPATAVANVEGIYWPDTSGLANLNLSASSARVHVFEFERLETASLRQYALDRSRSFELNDVRLSIVGASKNGWMGYYAQEPGGDTFGVRSMQGSIRASERALGNTADESGGAPESRFPAFHVAPQTYYALSEGALDVTHEGPVALKVLGPTLRLVSRENDTTYWTGTQPSETLPGASTVRWILITTSGGHLAVAASGAVEMAVSSATIRGTSFRAEAATGLMEVPEGAYVATSESADFTGVLTLSVEPGPTTAAPTLAVTVSGTLTGTSLSLARARVAEGPGLFNVPLVTAGVVLLVLASAVLVRVRSGRPSSYSVEQMIDLAYAAADGGRFAEALEWIRKCRELAPTSERLQMDEAAFLGELGAVEEALARLREIAQGSREGEADYYAALLMSRTGSPVKDAIPHLVRAVERTPYLALEARDEPLLRHVSREPEVRLAIAAALRRLDAMDAG